MDVPKTLEEWNARGQPYMVGHLGIEFTHVAADRVEARMPVRDEVWSWNGFLHAGSVVTLADTCCGYGTVCALPEGATGFTTVELKSNFVGTAREGIVLCVATPLHTGRATQVWDAVVTAETTGKTMAHFRCTQLILWPR